MLNRLLNYVIKIILRKILKQNHSNIKPLIRKLETVNKRIINLRLHLEFNEISNKKNLLPNYTYTYVIMYVYTVYSMSHVH